MRHLFKELASQHLFLNLTFCVSTGREGKKMGAAVVWGTTDIHQLSADVQNTEIFRYVTAL